MTVDSTAQYVQASRFSFNTHHPPIMAGLWAVLLRIHDGSQPVLFFQIMFYVISWAIILFYLIDKNKKILFCFVFLMSISPFMINFVGVIWKDVHVALAWFLATSIIVLYPNIFRFFKILLLVVVWYGFCVRHNSLFGVIPIIFIFSISFFELKRENAIKITLFVIGVFCTFLFSKSYVEKHVLKALPVVSLVNIMLHDMAAIHLAGGQVNWPDTVRRDNPDLEKKLKGYTPRTVDTLNVSRSKTRVHVRRNALRQKPAIVALRKAWLQSIWRNPKAYITHRFRFFANFLHVHEPKPYFVWANSKQKSIKKPWNKFLKTYVLSFKYFPFMYGWF